MIVTRLLKLLSEPKYRPVDYEKLVPKFPFVKGIPQKIVQTCKELGALPAELKNNIETIRNLHPGWSYLLFDDSAVEEYIKTNYGQDIWSYYNRISPRYGAAKADIFRYLFLYREGGVYLDIKSSVTRSLDEHLLPDDSFLLSFWDNLPGQKHEGTGHYSPSFKDYPRGEIPQWCIISSKGNPLLRKVIIRILWNMDEYNPYVNGVGWTGVVYTTGPVPFSLTIYENMDDDLVRQVDFFNDFGIVYSIYEEQHGSIPYHASRIKSDYRKEAVPVIMHRNRCVEKINERYLVFLRQSMGRKKKP